MNAFVLIVTFSISGTSGPSKFEADFASRAACENAQVAVLKEAALFSAYLRRLERERNIVIGIPQTTAVCHEANSN